MRPLDPARVLRRRARRAHLDRSGGDVVSVTRSVVALHATDPATMHLSVLARQPARPIQAVAAELKRAMEADRSLVRLLAMRRTLHVVDRSLAAAVLALARTRVAPMCQKLATRMLAEAGAPPLDELRGPVLAALADGDVDTEGLQRRVPALGLRVGLAPGKKYAAEAPMSRFVLEVLCTEGRVIRARTTSGWRGSRNTWARRDAWLPDLPEIPEPRAAYLALARAWLGAFGPGTLDDLAWWAGLPKGDAGRALEDAGAVPVEVRGWPGVRYQLPDETWQDDGPPVPPAFLPALDPSGMCWTDRSPFLDPAFTRLLFDSNGNLAPTVWVDGRIVGGWGCRKSGEVVYRVLDSDTETGPIEAEARLLTSQLGGEAVAPRFPTPITRELQAHG